MQTNGSMTMKPHPVVHFEIGCREGESTREFFSQLFGWEISGHDAGMIINTGGSGAIGGHTVELAPEWGQENWAARRR